jgi:hypothetical protein
MCNRFWRYFTVATCLLVVQSVDAYAAFEAWGGRGPVVFRVTLPVVRDGAWEPLLTIGKVGEGDVIFCRRLADGRVVFGWEQTGQAAIFSKPVESPPGTDSEVMIAIGCMLPAEGSPFYAAQPELSRLSRIVLVQFQGQPVLAVQANFVAADLLPVLGRNDVGGTLARPFYSGKISEVRTVSPTSVLQALTIPIQLAPSESETFHTKQYPGALKILLLLPEGNTGRIEPLVTTGVADAGDFVYVRYVDDQHVQIGFDHWRVGGPISEPIFYKPGMPHDITVSIGSLLPLAGGEPGPKEPASLRTTWLVLFDGIPVLRWTQACYPSLPENITVGTNAIGGSTTVSRFSGTIQRLTRIPHDELPRLEP